MLTYALFATMTYDNYIFDLDGTLLNTLSDLAASTNYALSRNHLPQHTIDEVRRMVGNGVETLIRRAVPADVSSTLMQQVLSDFRSHYLHHSLDTTAPYPGIIDMLERLRCQKCRTAVVSNKFQAATSQLCDYFFGGLVDVAIGEDEAHGIRRKPAPDPVLSAMRSLGASPVNTVYVGDSDVDILTAKNSGIPCVSVLWGFRDKLFLQAHGATTFISDPSQLP